MKNLRHQPDKDVPCGVDDSIDDYVKRLLEFAKSFSEPAKAQLSMTQKRAGPDSRPGRVSDIWALGGGVLFILLSGLTALVVQNSC
jgi:hypothetical protein